MWHITRLRRISRICYVFRQALTIVTVCLGERSNGPGTERNLDQQDSHIAMADEQHANETDKDNEITQYCLQRGFDVNETIDNKPDGHATLLFYRIEEAYGKIEGPNGGHAQKWCIDHPNLLNTCWQNNRYSDFRAGGISNPVPVESAC